MSDRPGDDHPVEISRDQWLRVSWRCDTCAWVGHNIGSEMTAHAEHARVAADIAAGRLAPGPAAPDTAEGAGRG